ncbi:MAG: SDR family oxidoreductase [Bacteroidota bacterium]
MANTIYLITGASSDIGFYLIRYLISQDKFVIGTCRKPTSEIQSIVASNFELITNIDFEKKEDLIILQNTLESKKNILYKVIHCIGNFWHHKSIPSTSHSEAKDMVLSHYLTTFNLLKLMVPIMKKNNGGRILVFTCNSVIYTYPEMAAFTSAKAAVETLVKCSANENSQYNIVINALALSTIKTKKVINSKKEKYHDEYLTLEELKDSILYTINGPIYINGNIIKILKYSQYFYHESYYDRNEIIE